MSCTTVRLVPLCLKQRAIVGICSFCPAELQAVAPLNFSCSCKQTKQCLSEDMTKTVSSDGFVYTFRRTTSESQL